jgi:hypothetical protein
LIAYVCLQVAKLLILTCFSIDCCSGPTAVRFGQRRRDGRCAVHLTRGARPEAPKKPKPFVFTGSNWGPNDAAAKARADKALALWKEKNAVYTQQLAAWEAKGGDQSLTPGYQQMLADAKVQASLTKRLQAAARGEIDPTEAAALQQLDNTERNRLYHQLGPGWETSSAGLDFLKRKSEAYGNVARSDLSTLLGQLPGYQGAQQQLAAGLAQNLRPPFPLAARKHRKHQRPPPPRHAPKNQPSRLHRPRHR